MAVRIRMFLSGLAIFFLSVALADFLVVGGEGTRVYVVYYLLWLTVALAFIGSEYSSATSSPRPSE